MRAWFNLRSLVPGVSVTAHLLLGQDVSGVLREPYHNKMWPLESDPRTTLQSQPQHLHLAWTAISASQLAWLFPSGIIQHRGGFLDALTHILNCQKRGFIVAFQDELVVKLP